MNKRSLKLTLIVAWFVLVGTVLFAAAVPVTPLWAGLTNNSGQPLSPGRVYFYIPGTTTAKSVWDEATKITARSYVDLDAYGRAQVYGDGIYKLTVCDRTTGSDVTLYSIDNLEVQTATTSSSITPTTAVIASATITTITANGGTINSTTINSPTIVGGSTNGTTFTNGTISSSTITTSTLTSPTISGGGFSGSQTGMSINSPAIVSPVITGTGTAVLASATITTLTVTTLNATGLTWAGIGLSGVSITGASTINGATLDSCTINNPTFGGTTGAGTLKNLTLLEGPTSSYSGLAVAKTYVDEHMLDNSTHGCSAIASTTGVAAMIAAAQDSGGTSPVPTVYSVNLVPSTPVTVASVTITNSDTASHKYFVTTVPQFAATDVSTQTAQIETNLYSEGGQVGYSLLNFQAPTGASVRACAGNLNAIITIGAGGSATVEVRVTQSGTASLCTWSGDVDAKNFRWMMVE